MPLQMKEEAAVCWLESLSLEQFERLKKVQKKKVGNDFIYLFGKRYNLKVYDLNEKKVVFKNNSVYVYHKNYLDLYLKVLLKEYIEKRISELNMIDFDVKVEIQQMTSKYGVCFYTQNRIKFAASLIHEPQVIIDSVIIHELAHFYYPNHQKGFYQLLQKYNPNYKQHQAFLKAGGVGDD